MADTDDIQLLGPHEARRTDSIKHSRRSLRNSLKAFQSWWTRAVLLSGAHYEQLDNHPTVTSTTHGWRFAALISALFVGLCLLANIAFAVYARLKFPINADGVGDFGISTCSEVLSTTSKIHIGINVLATILIAASNFNMQCLTAPTRPELDRAHQSGRSLDVGVQSVANLRHIQKWKVLLWIALLLSTLPLHFLWNSAVFAITTANRYGVLVVQSNYQNNDNALQGLNCNNSNNTDAEFVACQLLTMKDGSGLERLDPGRCMRDYPSKLAADRANLLVVTKSTNTSQSSDWKPPGNASLPLLAYFDSASYSMQLKENCLYSCSDWCKAWDCTSYCNSTVDHYGKPYDASKVTPNCYKLAVNNTSWDSDDLAGTSDWLCSPEYVYNGGCSLNAALNNQTNWAILPEGYQVDYCLAAKSSVVCKLQYSSIILYVVIACNAIKLAAILAHIYFNKDQIMATVGDALASFLERNDPTTRGKCLHSSVLAHSDGYEYLSIWPNLDSQQHPLRWERDSNYVERWHQGASWSQVFICMLLWLTCIALGIVFLVKAVNKQGSASILTKGFGTMNIGALVGVSSLKGGSVGSILTTSVLVNLPQVLLSSLYFMYNTIYTCMASAYEWSLYARFRKSLRVTDRQGMQRSTYWLQLPFRFSLPLIAFSAILHWLVSQSSFLVNLTIITVRGKPQTDTDPYVPFASETGTTTAIGYSPLAMLCGLSVAVVMLIALVTVMQFKLQPGIPLVGSNSFAISAACHPPKDDVDVSKLKVMWGAVSHQSDAQPGHCCFTSLEIEKPRFGEFYAGDSKRSVGG